MKKLLTYILLTVTLMTTFGLSVAYAEGDFKFQVVPKPKNLPGPVLEENKPESGRTALVDNILPKYTVTLIGFVGAAALLFLVIAGVRFGVAYGNEEAVEKAKNQTIYALVGFVIALLSYTIVTIIVNLEFKSSSGEQLDGSPTIETPEPSE